MAVIVILRLLDVEVWVPAKLAKYISIFRYFRVFRHTSSLDLVLLIWVKLSAWFVSNICLSSKWLVKVLLLKVKVNRD